MRTRQTPTIGSIQQYGAGRVVLTKIGNREGKHAAQFSKTVVAPFLPCMDKNFCIGLSSEAMTEVRKAFAKFAIVIQFAVEDYCYVAELIPNGLVSAGQINDAQTPHAESKRRRAWIIEEEAFAVRSTVSHCGGH